MSVTAPLIDSLYTAREDVVDLVDVPELAYLTVAGHGGPESLAFAEAVRALRAVSDTAHALLRQQRGTAPSMRPLEALWWAGDADRPRRALAGRMPAAPRQDRAAWRWQAMVLQPADVDARIIAQALHPARARHVAALDAVRFLHWTEGRCAQILHVGPDEDEAATRARLHAALAEAGYRPRGRHHEIYLEAPHGGGRRTVLRQPVEPALTAAPG